MQDFIFTQTHMDIHTPQSTTKGQLYNKSYTCGKNEIPNTTRTHMLTHIHRYSLRAETQEGASAQSFTVKEKYREERAGAFEKGVVKY